jgi:dTDP-4-dehydro-6-deoxy-alpha-D-glucopyranose 2,3-dehydratase
MNSDITSIDWFRDLLAQSQLIEDTDPSPILDWLRLRREHVHQHFKTQLIALREVEKWSIQSDTGNIIHDSGSFFSVIGVRINAGNMREVSSWDQPIMTQKSGGVLALLCKKSDPQIKFLLQGRVAPGNIDGVQIAPTIQSTWSNFEQAHGGNKPPFAEYVAKEGKGRVVYEADQNEEGGPFWEKVNSTRLILIDEKDIPNEELSNAFVWASLSQIKALSLMDNILSPFVKAIISPL